jgi:Holliday junction resolvase RusA-like endonuclease
MSLKAFALGVMVVYKRDVDLGHVFNAIEDALQELVWMNDRQVQRYLASEKTRVEVGLPFTRVVIQELEHVYRS